MTPLPGKIIDIHNEGGNRIGLVAFDGKRRAIYLSLVPDAQVGDTVLFHAGFATETVGLKELPSDMKSATPAMGDEEPDFETCRASRLLSELDPQQLKKLIPLAQNESHGAGDIIFRAGDNSRSLHLIASGEVSLEAVSESQAQPVQTLRAGDAMGWSALTPGSRTHFQARALTPVCTIAFQGEQLRAACERDPAIGYALMKRLVEMVTERLDAMRMKLAAKANA